MEKTFKDYFDEVEEIINNLPDEEFDKWIAECISNSREMSLEEDKQEFL